MPIQTISGQPLKLLPYHEPRVCGIGDAPCYLHQPLDPIRMQFKQISLGDNHSCDPYFSTVGAELVTNGSFTGSAAGWTLTNATWGADKVCFDGTLTASFGQDPIAINGATMYKIVFEVTGLTTGTFDVIFGGVTVAVISADGTYGLNVFPGAFFNIGFATLDGCDACFDNVSVKQLFPCWAYDNDQFEVTFNPTTFGNSIRHLAAGSATTFTADDTMIQGDYYQVKIRVQNRTQGSVQVFAGNQDALSTPITQNGTFTQYLYASETGVLVGDPVDFFFVMDADFDGTIEFIFALGLRTDYICTLLDQDGTPIADLSSHLVYSNEYVTLLSSGLQGILDFDGDPIPYGCYNISVIDPDGTNYVTNGEFDVNSDWFGSCYFALWFDSGQATGASDGIVCVPIELVQANSLGLVMGVNYVARFRYKSNFIDGGNNIRFDVCGTTVGNVSPTLTFQQFTSVPFQITNPANQIRFHFDYGDITLNNSMTIDSVEIFGIGEYETNCINYKAVHEDTYTVIGQGMNIRGSYGFGFLFQPTNLYVFFFYQRLRLGFRKPKYPGSFDAGAYSTGTHYKFFASSEKIYEVVFEGLGEIEHDCMALMIQCPRFFIAGNPPFANGILDINRYQCITEEYIPDWGDKGESMIADSVIEVQHLTDIVKISNL